MLYGWTFGVVFSVVVIVVLLSRLSWCARDGWRAGRGSAPPRGVDRHREVAEERDEPLGDLGRERAGAQGAGVLLEVRRVPRPDEHDVHPRLVRHEAIGGLGQRRHPAVREEAQRIARIEVV